jgi:SAM-dependent methyltransferase
MALRLLDEDVLFVHIPKCGGHWIESVFDVVGIAYRHEQPITNSCPRHGKLSDYAPAAFTFCTIRDVDSWMMSYWRFHMLAGHNRKIWSDDLQYHHRQFGPPLRSWQDFAKLRPQAEQYLADMQEGCDAVISMGDMVGKLTEILKRVGYDVRPYMISNVPAANVTNLKVELGGGTRARGDGFTNVDLVPEADFKWDLSQFPYPFPDASVNELYSSHCLEHLPEPHRVLSEIARICKVGAKVEIRVPHPNNPMAMCDGHKHVISPQQIQNADVHFRRLFWKGDRALKLIDTELAPTEGLEQAKSELPFLKGIDDQSIMRWISGTCHESRFTFKVVPNV